MSGTGSGIRTSVQKAARIATLAAALGIAATAAAGGIFFAFGGEADREALESPTGHGSDDANLFSGFVQQIQSPTIPPDPVVGRANSFRVWSYSKAFARRFNLPEMADEGLPEDVWAIELRVTKGRYVAPYDCYLNVYLSNRLKILFPGADSGSRKTLALGGRFPPGGGLVRSEDRVFHDNQLSRFRIKAALVTAAGTAQERIETIPYEEYHKNFLSDLAYLSFDLAGCLMIGGPKQEPPFVLWVEREGGRDYRYTTELDRNDFYRFPIPTAAYERFRDIARRTAAYTREHLLGGNGNRGREPRVSRGTQEAITLRED